MGRKKRTIGTAVLLTAFLVSIYLMPHRSQAADLYQQQQRTLRPTIRQPTYSLVREKLPDGIISDSTQKCSGDENGGCCVTATQKIVWGSFIEADCPVFSK